ncbi:MAG: hypothetical protein LUC16_00420, partial [Coprobacillus sp.]|nr:hypothetical protein [Coprobacillus sp.]
MRKNKFICLMGVVMLSLCGCEKKSSEVDEHEIYEHFFKPRVEVHVYNKDGEKITNLDYRGDEQVTFYTNEVYIFQIDISPKGGAVKYSDLLISFEYDEEYISLADCDEDYDWNNTYYFTGLKEIDETKLVIHHERVEDPKTLLITLVDSLEIDNE